jgi:transposase-like protein
VTPPPDRGRAGHGGDHEQGTRDPPRERKFTRAEKDAILAELEASGEPVPVFAQKRGLSGSTIYTWRSDARTGSSGADRQRKARGRGGAKKPTRRTFNGDERRQAVEAYLKSGMSQRPFAKLYGISEGSLGNWVRRHGKAGRRGSRPKSVAARRARGALSALPQATKMAIKALKAKFPDSGLRKVRDSCIGSTRSR